jgi:hypothetical protein
MTTQPAAESTALATADPHAAEQAYLARDREYRLLCAKSEKAAAARAALPPGSTRARVTSANARWMRAAEARDRRAAEVLAAFRAGNALLAGAR